MRFIIKGHLNILYIPSLPTSKARRMALTTANKLGHIERTAAEPRDKSLSTVILRKVDKINDQIRLFRLEIPLDGPQLRFLPGQWLDVYCPGVPKAGGFTITSPPSKARPSHSSSSSSSVVSSVAARGGKEEEEPQESEKESSGQDLKPVPGYVELAVQKSPANPPAAWLWQDDDDDDAEDPSAATTTILGRELRVRVGGSFVWPPPGINVGALRRVVFVAGGVGINPLISMVSSLVPGSTSAGDAGAGAGAAAAPLPFEVKFLYSVKDPLTGSESGPGEESKSHSDKRDAGRILFLDRLVEMLGDGERKGELKGELKLYLTGGGQEEKGAIQVSDTSKVKFLGRRMDISDIEEAVGGLAERRFAVVYVCGVPDMTDTFVDKLRSKDGLGMEPHRVLCEKWW